jgi:tubulin-folding cofactor B
MAELRDYVTGRDHEQYANLPAGVVSVLVTHNLLNATLPEIKLDLHETIFNVKAKLYRHCGTGAEHCYLILKAGGDAIARMDEDDRMLGYYGVESGMEIHIVDENPFSLARGGGLEDVSLVEKYVMSDEDYAARKGTLREYKLQRLKEDPNFKFFKNEGMNAMRPKKCCGETKGDPNENVENVNVGDRCEVNPGSRRGTVSYKGPVEGLPEGTWIGVTLDMPQGKGDGSKNGVRYYDCSPGYGAFVRARNVIVGDFPEEDLLLSDEEDEL